jgi:hypothetical protein
MRNGPSDERLGLRHLARILGCRAEASQRIGQQGWSLFADRIRYPPDKLRGEEIAALKQTSAW